MLLFTSVMKPVLSFNRSCVRKKKSQIMAEIGGENMSKLAIYSMGPFFLFLKNLIFLCFLLEEWKLNYFFTLAGYSLCKTALVYLSSY